MKKNFGCPVKATADAISGKWKIPILWYLSFAPRRFGELRRLLTGVSEKVLAAQLKELERDGIVKRTSTQTVPTRVDYVLSQAGEALIPVLESMCDWGIHFLGVLPSLPRHAANVRAEPHGSEVSVEPY